VRQFHTAPSEAAERFGGKTFMVRGTVVGFRQPTFIRRFDLELASPEPSLNVVCRFKYVDRYRAVYDQDDGKTLVGRHEGGGVEVLCRKGDEVLVKGRCRGLKGSRIEFTNCERVPLASGVSRK
jgi:hypothetical protein